MVLVRIERLLARNQDRFSFGLRRAKEVNGSVDSPDCSNAESEERLFECAQVEYGTDQVEGHASQIGEETKAGDEQVQDHVVVRAFVEGDNAQEAAERIQDEGTEVRSQCHDA